VLDPAEARMLLDSIDVSTHAGLRDRALIGLKVYSFARIGAALGMTVGSTDCRHLYRISAAPKPLKSARSRLEREIRD
jgi:integrase